MKKILLLLSLLGQAAAALFAQKPLLNVCLDRLVAPSDDGFLRTEIRFVNYVRDAALADVQVQQTNESPRNGTLRSVFYFFGQGRFEGQNDTVAFMAQPAESQGLIREKMLRAFKQGLLPYLLQTDWAESIDYALTDAPSNASVRDGWNLWTYNVAFNGRLSGGKFSDNNGFTGKYSNQTRSGEGKVSFDVWRTGQRWRGSAGVHHFGDYNWGRLVREPILSGDTTIISESAENATRLHFDAAYAINQRFSVGAWVSGYREYNNSPGYSPGPQHDFSVALGAEYSFFPYRDWFRRQFAVGYYASVNLDDQIRYNPSPVSSHIVHSAYLNYARIETWGYIAGRLGGDYRFGRAELWNIFNASGRFQLGINLRKGLFLTLGGDCSISNRQNYLTGGGSPPIIFSQNYRRQDCSTSVGISYYFGSGYQNIINPRLWRTNVLGI